jgi:hypothetical protein
MKKILILILIVVAIIAIAYNSKGERKVAADAFTLKDGQSATYTYDMTSFKVMFDIKEYPQDPNNLRKPEPMYSFGIARTDSDMPELQYDFRIPGTETFTWKGLKFQLEFLGIDGSKATAKISKI